LVANPRVAVSQRIQQDGQWRDGDTSFLKVNVWRVGQAEHLAESESGVVVRVLQGPPRQPQGAAGPSMPESTAEPTRATLPTSMMTTASMTF
jgi:hypothetical protein